MTPEQRHAANVDAARADLVERHITAATDAHALADAVAIALQAYESTQYAHLPTGGGYVLPGRARAAADWIVDFLTASGWTEPRNP